MNHSHDPALAPKPSGTYNEDVVEYTQDDGSVGVAVVTRCWADEQAPEISAEAARLGIDFTPLRPGYLEILHPSGNRSEILEASTKVVDKGFLRGDVVRLRTDRTDSNKKKKKSKTQSGQIVELSTKVQLQRVITKEQLEGWFDAAELVAAARVNRGDHVVCGEWIGLVEEVFEMAMIEDGNGLVSRVCDAGTTLSVGDVSEAVLQMLRERTGDVFSRLLGRVDFKTILDVKQVVIAVNWLCQNQQAPADDASWQRPKRYWTDMDQLKQVRATADHLHTIHDKVVFRDPTSHPPPPSAHSETYPQGHRVLVITNTRTTVTVLWQDGTIATIPSHDLEPVVSVDEETDVFPGDVGLFSGVTPSRVGVVQSMDARKRTIKMRYLDSPAGVDEGEETISGLEFDPHGPPPDAYGVRRGDYVMITKEGEGNGAKVPVVPSLGESETLTGMMPGGEELRAELSTLGLTYATTLDNSAVPPRPQSSPNSLSSIHWYGEVWDLLLDGTTLIRFPDNTKQAFPNERLVHLDDGMDPESGMPMEGQEGMEMEDDEEDSEAGSWITDDGVEREGGMEVADIVLEAIDGSDDDMGSDEEHGGKGGWADEDESMRVDEAEQEQGAGADARRDPAALAAAISSSASDIEVEASLLPNRSSPLPSTSTAPSSAPTPSLSTAPTAQVSMPSALEEDFADWSRFEVLEEVPDDHHYKDEQIQVPGKAFISRVRKEYAVLASSLPPNILVRAYESRLDLLRCLIIGPLETPFQNAPFLFDVYLPPSKFPQEPPQVFFHSWAGGTRVSPNLYTEGKVCLSLLGTWGGDKTESWGAARSSILQIFISIQALIMVEQPYFTEPGFEKQLGTPEATAASELYNERTLTLTRAFVKRACEYPPSNFVREIAAYYFNGLPGAEGRGALEGIIEQSRRLLEESEGWLKQQAAEEAGAEGEAEGEGEGEEAEQEERKPPVSQVVPTQRVLTEGAGLSLRRTLKGLEELRERGPRLP
ncbi:hypothetical protein JCM11641_007339 [Rhodosporidiobolus odoratus]